ncbi:MAG: polysaccharide biosynthesis tyrosine autokinase, partial [Bacteroidota bacterium]|nr:polysaccharide biosynthesis tyrosine autokinase [Bacteroidota bacterium]
NTESQLYVQRSGQYEQRRLELGTQIGIIKDLENYVNKSGNSDQLLPSGIGVLSTGLNALISEYNNLLLERKRLSHTATENNQVMVNLKDRTDALFRTVQSSINNEKRNLIMSQQDITAKERENAARIKSIPRYERTISDLSRQQDVKSQLYLYLLQKKDENYLNTSTVTPKFKTIGYPRSNGVPVSPERDVIYLLAFLAGVLLPFTGVSIRNILHFTVENREELRKISSVPILGEIPKSSQPNSIIIQENATDGFTEMFRLLRTNLMFVLNEPWKKVINVVSTIKGEGKTSIAINLALSLALLDKKVLILGLDIRKPKMGKFIGLDNMTGVTQYLSGQLPLTKLVRPSGIHPNLWAITSGPTPPNPNELLAKPALDELITLYRNQFDYIVIDTPPIGAVSDSLLLNRFADVNLYVVRADYTHKGDIQEANEVYNNQMLNNMYFVLNAADMRKSSSYRYGYRKRYGYGYGYYEQKRKKKVANPAPTA